MGTRLLRPWIDGASAWTRTAYIRDDHSTADRSRFLATVADLAASVDALHRKGYRHGDLQPGHFLIGEDEAVTIVDYDVAVRIDAGSAPYSGGLVHYVAPEIAAGMIAGNTAIPVTAASEVYALGAMVFHLYTGRVPHWYGADPREDAFTSTGLPEKCRAIVDGRRRTLLDCDAPDFPELDVFLSACMSPHAADRPTLAAVEAIRPHRP
ncbi:protein kinase domain-containing protein [Stackebrandtia soli]|uniref:protein kinase domain-containing protein n=1 Tax=Stackebrandtia soli TaxID=1892856 RepID=UPI0039EA9448